MKPTVGLMLCAWLVPSSVVTADAPALGTLEVVIDGVRPRPGTLVVRVYKSADGWLTPEGALRTLTAQPTDHASVRFEGLAAGRYAASVVHDENGNLKMDLKLFPFPHRAEGGGVSNDASGHLGPPAFADAAFDFGAPGKTIRIKLTY